MYRGDPTLFRCCAEAGRTGNQCRRTAMKGRLFCDTHGTEYLWHIRIQKRSGLKPGCDPRDWKSWRHFSVWPKTFRSREEAQDFMSACFTFKGLSGRKMSASVVRSRRRVLRLDNHPRAKQE